MRKVLNNYYVNPTLKNAQKVRAYERAHPMAACMINKFEADILASAIHHANKGEA